MPVSKSPSSTRCFIDSGLDSETEEGAASLLVDIIISCTSCNVKLFLGEGSYAEYVSRLSFVFLFFLMLLVLFCLFDCCL